MIQSFAKVIISGIEIRCYYYKFNTSTKHQSDKKAKWVLNKEYNSINRCRNHTWKEHTYLRWLELEKVIDLIYIIISEFGQIYDQTLECIKSFYPINFLIKLRWSDLVNLSSEVSSIYGESLWLANIWRKLSQLWGLRHKIIIRWERGILRISSA